MVAAAAGAGTGAAPEGQTLLQRLDHWCHVQPNKVRWSIGGWMVPTIGRRSIDQWHNPPSPFLQRLFTFLDDHGREVDSLTYKVGFSQEKTTASLLMIDA